MYGFRLKGKDSIGSSTCISLFHTMGLFSSVCLQRHLWEKGRSTNPDLKKECAFCFEHLKQKTKTRRHNRKPLLKRKSMDDLSPFLGLRRSNTDQFLIL